MTMMVIFEITLQLKEKKRVCPGRGETRKDGEEKERERGRRSRRKDTSSPQFSYPATLLLVEIYTSLFIPILSIYFSTTTTQCGIGVARLKVKAELKPSTRTRP